MTVRIGLLGPFAVEGAHAPEPIRGLIPQAIIARLALEPGRTFATDELVEALWAEPPAGVVSSLRAHISRLRARGWDALLIGGRSGYRLEVRADAVDVLRYRRLVEADGDERAAALDLAERLWRGAPLAAMAGFPFAPAVSAELTELHRRTILELTGHRLDSGAAEAAIAGIAALAADLADEQAGALLARALHASGRTAEALAEIDLRARGLREAGVPADELARVRLSLARPEEASRPGPLDAAVQRTGVPAPVTPFIGRERELDAVRRGRAESRLVTLTGPAGVGKTRLAVEVARRAGADEDERQHMVDLASVQTPDRVTAVVADAVGASEHTIDSITAAVTGRRVLMILDNAEHVLGSVAALCARLLERCEGLGILVTSRESMRMPGERVIAIEPLLGSGLADAVELFLQRATASSGIGEWSEAQRRSARALCAALDGLPLAIELAAARMDVLTVDELAVSLEGAGEPAEGGRHDSIDDAIAWSLRTATDAERGVLSQLAEFSGAFSLEAVAATCIADGADPRELAVGLARRSLVSTVGPIAGERRFRVLDTVKRHMRRRHPLDDPGSWRRRHADWMTEFAERVAPGLRTAEATRARASLVASRADLDDALRRLTDWGDGATALRLVGALAWHWYERGVGPEATAIIAHAVELAAGAAPRAEAAALYAASFMCAVSGDAVATVTTIQRFADAAYRAADPAHAMIAHTLLASLAGVDGAEAAADAELEAARLSRAQVAPADVWAVADHLYIQGDALRILGRPAQALDSLEEAYRLASDLGQTWTLASTCYITGKVLVEVGRARDAVGIHRTGIRLALDREDGTSAAAGLSAAAVALAALGERSRAAEIFGLVDVLGPRFGLDPIASDGAYASAARHEVRMALGEQEWTAATTRGRARDVRSGLALLG